MGNSIRLPLVKATIALTMIGARKNVIIAPA
jgi:hypothetical protein